MICCKLPSSCALRCHHDLPILLPSGCTSSCCTACKGKAKSQHRPSRGVHVCVPVHVRVCTWWICGRPLCIMIIQLAAGADHRHVFCHHDLMICCELPSCSNDLLQAAALRVIMPPSGCPCCKACKVSKAKKHCEQPGPCVNRYNRWLQSYAGCIP